MIRSARLLALLVPTACGDSVAGSASSDTGMPTMPPTSDPSTGTPTTSLPTTTAGGETTTTTTTSGTDSASESGGTTFKFNVPDPSAGETGPSPETCKVTDDRDALGECKDKAPPDSFEPEIQWTWTGVDEPYSIVTPLVANLTDDNGDGAIDLCDVPDVVVVTATYAGAPGLAGHINVLGGADGALHFRIPTGVDNTVTPAIGDIDGDGLPEIVTAIVGGNPVAFKHDGTMKWVSASDWPDAYSGAIALADADNDGDVEILAGNRLFDHEGVLLFTAPVEAGKWSASTFADLDGDGDLELVLGNAAYHHDGTLHYMADVKPGYPAVANLDRDPEPEVLVTNPDGLALLDHDGAIHYSGQTPTGDPPGFNTWLRPATVHDFDGDGDAEYATSSAANYTLYDPEVPTIVWQAAVSDLSGIAAGTAFDFLGDGIAEAMYADERFMFIFDGGTSDVLLQIPRTSATLSEYPIVVDVDNDGSAEIIVVSGQIGDESSPTVQVIRDKMDRWIQARRIWNQHTYHVTNVREDGTIPQFEKPSWAGLNTFRTNSQIENGGVCKPRPPL